MLCTVICIQRRIRTVVSHSRRWWAVSRVSTAYPAKRQPAYASLKAVPGAKVVLTPYDRISRKHRLRFGIRTGCPILQTLRVADGVHQLLRLCFAHEVVQRHAEKCLRLHVSAAWLVTEISSAAESPVLLLDAVLEALLGCLPLRLSILRLPRNRPEIVLT